MIDGLRQLSHAIGGRDITVFNDPSSFGTVVVLDGWMRVQRDDVVGGVPPSIVQHFNRWPVPPPNWRRERNDV